MSNEGTDSDGGSGSGVDVSPRDPSVVVAPTKDDVIKQKLQEKEPQRKMNKPAKLVEPGTWETETHFYTKVLNSQIHPLVSYFLGLGYKRIIDRYCHLNPRANKEVLTSVIKYKPSFFRWSGSDLFYVAEEAGNRKMVVVETNSCPSGQKSMPPNSDDDSDNGYRKIIKHTMKKWLAELQKSGELPEGELAVIYDKNYMEASGYACAMADVFQEKVWLVEFYDGDTDASVRWNDDNVMEVRTEDGSWRAIRAAWRYVTSRPWNRIRITNTRTAILNPVLACLAGGRNKMVAAQAYEFFNQAHSQGGLAIHTPETIRDVTKDAIPLWVRGLGGKAVVKVPYSNAGQGVYTITNEQELQQFMQDDKGDYDKYIVQSLVGNSSWSSTTRAGQYFHVGTVPNTKGLIYAVDIRMMIHYDYKEGAYRPLVIYSRRARCPLAPTLTGEIDSWDMLGTNLSVKEEAGWSTETARLLLMDRRDFNSLGIGLDDLIDGYVQTVMATVAIDQLACKLLTPERGFDRHLFESINQDPALLKELLV